MVHNYLTVLVFETLHLMGCMTIWPLLNCHISLNPAISCHFQSLLELSRNLAIQFNSITNRAEVINCWWINWLSGVLSQKFFFLFENDIRGWIIFKLFIVIISHIKRVILTAHEKITLSGSSNINWHFETLNSKLDQIGKNTKNINFCQKKREKYGRQ